MDNRTGRGHDATGRSSGRTRLYGTSAKRWKFDEGFIGEPMSLLESPGYRALNFPALKILGFLKLEHVRHGGTENGRLMAPYRQLEALGISARKIKPALVMLEAFGIIALTSNGSRMGGRPNAATYALTWLPTCDGLMPTETYKNVSAASVGALTGKPVSPARDRKAGEPKTDTAPTSEGDPPAQVKATPPKTSPITCTSEGGTTPTSEGTIYILGGARSETAKNLPVEPSNPVAARKAAAGTGHAHPKINHREERA